MPHLTRRLFLATLATLPCARLAQATPAQVSTDANGVALQGYDTHAYWQINAPRTGSPAHVVHWHGSPWHFATARDAAAFRATPEAFAPQFGGFCTRAMSFRKIVDGDPEVWRIHAGKLYLFALPKGGKAFDKDPAPMIAKAQAFWDSRAET